jgi:uncharacterized RDD family membrane protein YckC
MSQPPGGDPPSEQQVPLPDRPPEPDAETARVRVGKPSSEGPIRAPDAPPALTPPSTPSGIISADPVGWTGHATQGSAPASPGDSAPGEPVVGWASPAPPAQHVTEGVVIAGVFARLVAYSVDGMILLCLNIVVNGIIGTYTTSPDDTLALVVSGVLIGVDFLYFVGLWTSGWQATLGMRLLKLRVLGAQTAGTLPANDALLRWLGLSGAVSILTLVPGIGPYISLAALIWILALLVSTSTDRLHQGLHDRWARSVVVQPAPGGSGAAVITCLILVVLVAVVLPLGLLAVAGDQIEEILSSVGRSI